MRFDEPEASAKAKLIRHRRFRLIKPVQPALVACSAMRRDPTQSV
jgi:hypothetical protein